jgi:hypothetical protein
MTAGALLNRSVRFSSSGTLVAHAPAASVAEGRHGGGL